MSPRADRNDAPLLFKEGRLARIVLNRPERHNALEASDVLRLRDQLEDVDTDEDVRVLVLTGSGDETFCSGASLRQMESGEMSADLFQTLTDRLAAVRLPTVCALNGSAFGGGAEIALCCDFRIGVTGARMAVPAARLGICYSLTGLRRYVSHLGLSATRRLMIAGEEFDTEEMLRCGFVDRVVARADLAGSVDELCERLVGMAPLATRAMKRVLADIAQGTLDVARARSLAEQCAASDDLQEGLRARLERRPPEFHGR